MVFRSEHRAWRTRWRVVLFGVLWLLAVGAVHAAESLSGEVHLTLEDAVFQLRTGDGLTGPRSRLEVDLVCRDGVWEDDAYGWAWNFNRADHYGTLRTAMAEGDRLTLDLAMEIDYDAWVAGGMADYHLDIQRKGDRLTGKYTGAFRGVEVAGIVNGEVAPLPAPSPGFARPEAGEHPRLLIRRSELPALRAKAQTEMGKKLIARMQTDTDNGLAMGLLYNLTGEQRYADRCRDILERQWRDRTGGAFATGNEHGRRQQLIALTFDLAYNGLDERFRSKIAGYLWYYNARSALRPGQLAPKTNYLPGSNDMAFIAAGIYTSQAAIWDAPGAFPPEPMSPVMTRIAPQDGAADAPVVPLEPGQVITAWLYAGPFVAYPDRESYLVPAERQQKPAHGRFHQHIGQDFLAALGGAGKARPDVGTPVAYHGRTCSFAPLDSAALQGKTGAEQIDLWTANRNVPCSAGYFYAELQNARPGWYTVRLDPTRMDARNVNLYLGGEYKDFTPDSVPFRIDATLYLGGQALHEGDAVYLDPGRYPMMVHATTRQYRACLQPRFEATTEAEAQAALAKRQAVYDKAHPVWENYFEAYYRRPLYNICERKARRLDQWAQGSAGYKNESGANHDYIMPVENMLAQAYLNFTGIRLPNIAMNGCCAVATDQGTSEQFATGFAVTPDRYKPAVLWAWQRQQDFDSNAVFTFLNYPQEMQAHNPQGILPSPYADRQQGYYLFHNGWSGADAIVADIYYKSFPVVGWNRPNAGTFSIAGLGYVWAWRGDERTGDRYVEENVVQFPQAGIAVNEAQDVGPGRVTSFTGKPNGSGAVAGSLNDVLLGLKLRDDGSYLPARDYGGRMLWDNTRDLGLRDYRAFAADYSGASGAPGLFVVVDRTGGATRKYWQMLLPDSKEPNRGVMLRGQTFTIKQGNATLVGTFVGSPTVKVKLVAPGTRVDVVDGAGKPAAKTLTHPAIWAEGTDDFFVVMTLQRGPAPAVKVQGTGLRATVTVGKQTIRFDGERILLAK